MWKIEFISFSAGHYLSSGFGSGVSQVSILCSVALAQGDGINTYRAVGQHPRGVSSGLLESFSWFALTRGFQRLEYFFQGLDCTHKRNPEDRNFQEFSTIF